MTGGNGTKDYLLAQIRGGGTLTGGQQLKLCLMLSYPAIIAQVSSVLMQYIDTSMVGHLGAAAGASIGLVSTCMWLLMGFCGACGSGFSVQVAHLIGANDFKTAREVLRQALVSALCFSGAIAVLGMAIAGPLPRWLGGTPEIIPDATKYFFIVSAFLPFMQLDWICASMLQVSGNMKVPSYLNIGMCLMDVCFNYLFIYVLDLGVVGAALGTGLAELITAMAMLYFLTVRSPELNLRQDRGSFRPTGKVIAKAAGIGGPMALHAITAESFCYMPGYGIADAATALVGQSVGAGRKELARRFAWITIGLGMGIMGLLAILMYAFAPEMMQMLSPDGEVISLGARVLRIEAFAELGYAASIVAYGVCVGAGDTKWPSVMNFTSMWIVRILPAIFLVKVYGLVGFWIAMAVELTFRGTIFLVRIARGKWLKAAV